MDHRVDRGAWSNGTTVRIKPRLVRGFCYAQGGDVVRTALPLIIALVSPHALAAQLECRVIGVADGDTLTCLTADRTQERIRLRGIDAPERKQPFGTRSQQNLSDLVHGKPVLVDWQKRGRWNRII